MEPPPPETASGLLALKATLTPLLIAAASLAQRRWGSVAGGVIAGLPLTSAPVSVFLALEQGPGFAGRAAAATLLGVTAMSAFCASYALAAIRRPWGTSALAGLAICLSVTALLSLLPTGPLVAAVVTFPAIAAMVALMGRPAEASGDRASLPAWDLPARMAAATGMVLAITGFAPTLGAKWSGLLSTLPVFALVMGAFSHAHEGAQAARRFLRGVAVGAVGSAAFLLVVALLVERRSLPETYALATVGSIVFALAGKWLVARLDARKDASRPL